MAIWNMAIFPFLLEWERES